MKSYVTIEILGRLRRDVGRLDALLSILQEIEDEEAREKLETFDKNIREYRKPMLFDLARVEKEIVTP